MDTLVKSKKFTTGPEALEKVKKERDADPEFQAWKNRKNKK